VHRLLLRDAVAGELEEDGLETRLLDTDPPDLVRPDRREQVGQELLRGGDLDDPVVPLSPNLLDPGIFERIDESMASDVSSETMSDFT